MGFFYFLNMSQRKDKDMNEPIKIDPANRKAPKHWTKDCPEEVDYQEWRKAKLRSDSKYV
jgi:hypothetical protein